MGHVKTSGKFWLGIFSVLLSFLVYFVLPESCPEAAKRAAFVFVLAAFFWAFEIIPVYATSLLVVLMLIILLTKPGGVLGMDQSGYQIFLVPISSPVIMLFLGGFLLSAALTKYGVDSFLARRLLRVFGNKPFHLLLGFSCTAAFLSMWISNTATAAMMFALVAPLIWRFDSDDGFPKALVLSIAFGCNIGGIATPIGSPPNAIAIGFLIDYGVKISFVQWMINTLPFAIIILSFSTFVLNKLFPSIKTAIDFQIPSDNSLKENSIWVILIALFTVFLWLTGLFPESVVALLAAGALIAGGFLDEKDIRGIDWHILILMWGGLALGVGVQESGLSDWVVNLPIFGGRGFLLVIVFSVLAVMLSSFISNTAAATLLLPIVMSLHDEQKIMIAFTVALSCSLAMAFPISTPPNAMAFSTETISSRDMLKSGLIVSMFSLVLILLGYKFVLIPLYQLLG
jgi:sodium-dependent dicarboxylate transporter 2/3/5